MYQAGAHGAAGLGQRPAVRARTPAQGTVSEIQPRDGSKPRAGDAEQEPTMSSLSTICPGARDQEPVRSAFMIPATERARLAKATAYGRLRSSFAPC